MLLSGIKTKKPVQYLKDAVIGIITVLLVVLKSHFFRFLTCFFFNSTHCVQTKAHYINLVLLPRDIILQKEKKLVALNFGHGSNSIRENILSGQTGHPKSHHVQKKIANCDFKYIDIFQRTKLVELFFLFQK